MFDVADVFEQHGHEIHYFSMEDRERNIAHDDAKYFVSNVDYKSTSYWQKIGKVRQILGKTIYSFESRRKIRQLIREIKPDVAHIHLIDHQISPSILPELKSAGIPIVQTIHEYKRICPNYRLYIEQKSEICTRCLSGNYLNCIQQKCLKESYTASALVAGAMFLHRWSNIWNRNIDISICSTNFVKDMMLQGGIPASQLTVLPYMIRLEDYEPEPDRDDYILYAGRLAPEKGLFTLLKAIERLPEIPLKIAGDGPLMDELKKVCREKTLDHVEFTGYVDSDTLRHLMTRSRFLVFPSQWYEPSGLSTWESQALERPVIGARIGGIPENIEDGKNGLLFEPGNADELMEKIQFLYTDVDACEKMGKAGPSAVESRVSGHYQSLLGIYESVIAKR